MRSKACQFQQSFAIETRVLSLLFSIISSCRGLLICSGESLDRNYQTHNFFLGQGECHALRFYLQLQELYPLNQLEDRFRHADCKTLRDIKERLIYILGHQNFLFTQTQQKYIVEISKYTSETHRITPLPNVSSIFSSTKTLASWFTFVC